MDVKKSIKIYACCGCGARSVRAGKYTLTEIAGDLIYIETEGEKGGRAYPEKEMSEMIDNFWKEFLVKGARCLDLKSLKP